MIIIQTNGMDFRYEGRIQLTISDYFIFISANNVKYSDPESRLDTETTRVHDNFHKDYVLSIKGEDSK